MGQRQGYIEYLRVIATFAVILDHILLVAIKIFSKSSTLSNEILVYGTRSVCHVAVPIFIMITGYLLLDPKRNVSLDSIKKYVIRMLVVLCIFGTIFAWIELVFTDKKIYVSQIYVAIYKVIIGKSWDHLWYLYMLIGLYLITPIIRAFIGNSSKKEIKYFLILNFIFLSLIPLIKELFGINIYLNIPIATIYPFYYVLGYYIGNDILKIKNSYVFIITVLSAAGIFFATIANLLLGIKSFKNVADFNSIMIVIFSIGIFILFKNSNGFFQKRYNNFIKTISRCSFGMYILHMFFINIAYKLFKINPFNNILIMIGIFLVVTTISFISTYVLIKTPFIKNYI